MDTIEAAKDQFTDEEYETLKQAAAQISEIEKRLTDAGRKVPRGRRRCRMDGDMSMPADGDNVHVARRRQHAEVPRV